MAMNRQISNFDTSMKMRERNIFDDVEAVKLISSIRNAIGNSPELQSEVKKSFEDSLNEIIDEAAKDRLDENKLSSLAEELESSVGEKENINKLRDYLKERDELNLAGLVRASQETAAEQSGDVELAVKLHKGSLKDLTDEQKTLIDYASSKKQVTGNTLSEFSEAMSDTFGADIDELIEEVDLDTALEDTESLLTKISARIKESTILDTAQNAELVKVIENLGSSLNLINESSTKGMADKIKEQNTQELLQSGINKIAEKLDNISISGEVMKRFEDATEDEELGGAFAGAISGGLKAAVAGATAGLASKGGIKGVIKGAGSLVTGGAKSVLKGAGSLAKGSAGRALAGGLRGGLVGLAPMVGFEIGKYINEEFESPKTKEAINSSLDFMSDISSTILDKVSEGYTRLSAALGDDESQAEIDHMDAFDERIRVRNLSKELLENKPELKDFNPQALVNINGNATMKPWRDKEVEDNTYQSVASMMATMAEARVKFKEKEDAELSQTPTIIDNSTTTNMESKSIVVEPGGIFDGWSR